MSRVLLIVDDFPEILRSYRRYMEKRFDAVHVASNSAEAVARLSTASPPVTHLVCDYWLGDGEPLGTVLIPRLRASCSSLSVAVLVTGSEAKALAPVGGVDAVFQKPFDIARLCEYLLAPTQKAP